MTTPLPVLPTLIVEAGLLPNAPVQASTFLRLDDPSSGLLDTATLGTAIGWTDISQWVMSFTVTRAATREQGPLWNYQAGTVSVLLDNSDGRFDPDNLAGPYIVGGSSQIIAEVPVRLRAVFAGTTYGLYSGFADGWLPGQVTYEGGYAEITLNATDAFKVLAGITLAPVAVEGTGADTGARITDILTRAGWYTSGERRLISTGNSTLQGTTLGDTALNLMQVAADSEIGQLYVNGSGAVVFRSRHALLTDSRSNTSQVTFGDLADVGQADGFEGGSLANWTQAGGCTIAASNAAANSGSWSMAMTSTGAGQLSAASCLAGNVASQGLPVTPNQVLNCSAAFQAATVARSASVGAQFYNAGGSPIVVVLAATATESTTDFTLAAGQLTVPGTAAYARRWVQVAGAAGAGEVHYVDDVSLFPAELAYAAASRPSDDTTLANDIQATRVGGTLQEVQNAGSIATYLFPHTYARSDLILQTDADALNWAGWMLAISSTGEDRFDSLAIDPQADPVNLWPQVLGRDIGDRITIWQRPAGVPSPVVKDCFIAGIAHTWDSASLAWLTTWTLMDATKYGSFLTLDNPVLGQLDNNALVF